MTERVCKNQSQLREYRSSKLEERARAFSVEAGVPIEVASRIVDASVPRGDVPAMKSEMQNRRE